MELETQPTNKNGEEMNSDLETQRSRDSSRKPINQNMYDSKNENT